MNINSINPYSAPSWLAGVSAPTGVPTGSASVAGSLSPSAAPASTSPAGQLLSVLQQLQQTNPGQFHAALTAIAGQLQTAAQQSTGSQSQMLSDLAAKFRQASATGDLSVLQPNSASSTHPAVSAYQQSGSSGHDFFSQAADVLSQVMGVALTFAL